MNLRPDSAWVYNVLRSSTKQTRRRVTELSEYNQKFPPAFLADTEPLRIESYILSFPFTRFRAFHRRLKTCTPLSVNDLIKRTSIDTINLELSKGAFISK